MKITSKWLSDQLSSVPLIASLSGNGKCLIDLNSNDLQSTHHHHRPWQESFFTSSVKDRSHKQQNLSSSHFVFRQWDTWKFSRKKNQINQSHQSYNNKQSHQSKAKHVAENRTQQRWDNKLQSYADGMRFMVPKCLSWLKAHKGHRNKLIFLCKTADTLWHPDKAHSKAARRYRKVAVEARRRTGSLVTDDRRVFRVTKEKKRKTSTTWVHFLHFPDDVLTVSCMWVCVCVYVKKSSSK